jgi:site-specific DNA recombinase
MIASHRAPQRKYLVREWELRGLLRCSCGVLMGTHTTTNNTKSKKLYHYYKCFRRSDYKRGMCDQKAIRAERVETAVWEFVSILLKDPERIRAGMDRLIEQERNTRRGDPAREAEAWAQTIAECICVRGAYQDQQAAGLMTLEELSSKLSELEERRLHAENAIAALRDSQERVMALEKDRDALIEAYSETVPEDLEHHTGDERNTLYRMLQLEVTPTPQGFYKVVGAFCSAEPLSA